MNDDKRNELEELRDEVNDVWQDVQELESRLERLDSTLSDIINGSPSDFDADVVETGQSRNQRDLKSDVKRVVKEGDGISEGQIKDELSHKWDESAIEWAIENLSQKGELYDFSGDEETKKYRTI